MTYYRGKKLSHEVIQIENVCVNKTHTNLMSAQIHYVNFDMV